MGKKEDEAKAAKVKKKKEEVESLMEVAFPSSTTVISRRTIKVQADKPAHILEPPPGRKPLLPRVYDYW
jgi:hypothetical protein